MTSDSGHWQDYSFNPARLKKMKAGADVIRSFLEQVLAKGLLNQSVFDSSNLLAISTRLVDCQIPTAARRIKSMVGLEHDPDNLSQFTAEMRWLGNIALFLERFDQLSMQSRLELWQACGGTVQKAKVLSSRGILDEWAVKKVTFTREDSLTTRTTWILGEKSGLWLCLLDYAFGQVKLPEFVKPGFKFAAQAHLYPGLSANRALVSQEGKPSTGSHPDIYAFTSINQMRAKLGKIYAANPFAQQIPLSLYQVVPDLAIEGLRLTDSQNDSLILRGEHDQYEEIAAMSGGHSIRMSLLYNREKIEIISVDYG